MATGNPYAVTPEDIRQAARRIERCDIRLSRRREQIKVLELEIEQLEEAMADLYREHADMVREWEETHASKL